MQLTGQITRNGVALSFQYADTYLKGLQPLPLSRHLPLQTGPFSDASTRAFFANLLPEGAIRQQIARQLGLSPDNIFGLLEELGGDCAGALTLLPEGVSPKISGGYRLLSDDELAAELDSLPTHPLLAGEEGVRLSLAGAQNKLPIYWNQDSYAIPQGNSPSTHILKTAIPNLQSSVVNEAFCMNLAAAAGLHVPAAQVVTIGAQQVYRVERFDRFNTAEGNVERLHQEDFCQALGIQPELKYEKEGGPGFKHCFQLVEEWSSEPLQDLQQLLNWALFNFIIGNADAHAKNLSFLYANGSVRLSPLYDLICTAVYPRVNNKFAMKMGEQKDPRYLQSSDLKHFSDEVGIDLRIVKRSLLQMAQKVSSGYPKLVDAYHMVPGAAAIIDDIIRIIRQRCGKAQALTAS